MEKTSAQNEESFRQCLSNEITDISYIQDLIVECDKAFAKDLPDEFASAFADMLASDYKNADLIETAITNYGKRSEGTQGTPRIGESLLEVALDDSCSLLTRLSAYELLRSFQNSHMRLVRNLLPKAETDAKEALTPLMGAFMNFDERSKTFEKALEDFGVEYMTGEQPDKGFTGRLRDLEVAFMGLIASREAKPAENMSVLSVLRLDHRKVNTLFKEIRRSRDPQKTEALYRQLACDLRSHSEAEEQIIYAFFREYDDIRQRIDNAQDAHMHARNLLVEMDSLSPSSDNFLTHLDVLENKIKDHINEEEYELFRLFRQKANREELGELSFEFSQRKKEIQESLSQAERPFRTPA